MKELDEQADKVEKLEDAVDIIKKYTFFSLKAWGKIHSSLDYA